MSVLNVRPAACEWLTYEGTPASLRVRLRLPEGSPVDVTDWSWQAWVGTGPPTVIECFGEEDGVTLYLRGSESLGLPGREWRFDVYGRDPAAGEGYTVLEGKLVVRSRVTVPA
jgi:hypothetical protein